MIFWILLILQIATGIVAGEAAIRKTPEGVATLEKLSKAGLFSLHWRAFSDYKQELFGLRKMLGIAAIIFSILFFALGKSVTNTPVAVLPGLFIFLWMAMQFGTDFKKSVREQFSMVTMFTIAPWGIFLLDYITDFKFQQIRTLVIPLAPLGIHKLPDLLITAMLSGFGLLGGIITATFAIFFLSMVPLFFLFLMVTSSTVSKRALSVSPRAAYIALENRGVI